MEVTAIGSRENTKWPQRGIPSNELLSVLTQPNLIERIAPDQIPATLTGLTIAAAMLGARMDSEYAKALEVSETKSLEQYLTVEEVADMLSVATRWVRTRAEQLGGIRLTNKTLRFPLGRVKAYLARRQI